MNERRRRAGWRWLVMLLGTGLVLTACSTGRGTADEGGGPPGATAAVPVETAVAEAGTLTRPLELSGRVHARTEVAVRPQLAGLITAVHAEVGQRVRQGQVLVELDAAAAEAQVQQAEAALAAARAAADQARRAAEVQRLQADAEWRQAELARQGAVAQLDGARQALAALEAQWQAAGCAGTSGVDPSTASAAPTGAAASAAPAGPAACAQLAPSLAQARAALRQAELALEGADVRLEAARRTRELAQRGDPAAAAEAQVAQAEAALALARRQRQLARVTAPVDGVVAAVKAQVGTLASPQAPDPLVVLVDGPARVEAELPAGLYDAVAPGTAVEVKIGSRSWPGRVAAKTLVPDARTGAYTLHVDLQPTTTTGDAAAAMPVPGQPANVRLSLSDGTRGVLIPADALLQGDEPGVGTVFVVESGRAVRRQVRFAAVTSARALIVEGLRPGEQVITRGNHGLAGGEPVQVVPKAGEDGSR